MLFNSYVFLFVFLPIILGLWYALGHFNKTRLALLVIASFVFYGWNHWEFTILLGASTIVDYFVGIWISRSDQPTRRFAWLMVSLATNLGLLGYFKYCGFIAESYNDVVAFLHTGSAIYVPDIMLPVGISFYTFQTLSYSIDIYRREVAPAKSFLHFAAFVSMFPQLVAGPIVRYQDIEDQMNSMTSDVKWDQIAGGIWFFVIGMSQKILIADPIASVIDPLLKEPSNLMFFSGWYALLGYTGQLYFDFAGYSNMAIGLGYFLGFAFPMNFNSPYKAVSIQDFWRRWHMTLSTFLRDYLYFPLGGSRAGNLISMRNLLIVMLLGGLWHGAGWTFVLWGAYHGILLAMHALYKAKFRVPIPRPVAIAVTFFAVSLGWLLFRSENMDVAEQWFAAISGFHGFEANLTQCGFDISAILMLVLAFSICWFFPNAHEYRPNLTPKSALALASLLVICVLRFDAVSPFLYFQF
jgi:alginate O-acetyltransferase complex protein AlgI